MWFTYVIMKLGKLGLICVNIVFNMWLMKWVILTIHQRYRHDLTS